MILSELLVGVREELIAAEDEKRNRGIKPAYRVSSINVELLVENIKKVAGGVDIKVVNFGARGEERNLHKISVTLTPLRKRRY